MGFFTSPGLDAITSGTKAAGKLGSDYTGIQSGYRAAGNKTAGQLFNMPANGGLNPYLKQQFGQEKEQIGKAYGDAVGAAQRGLTQRGMGVAPSGMQASIINSAGRNAGEATTSAYGDQMKNQLGLGLEGVKYNQEQQQLYNPLPAINSQIQGGSAMTAAGSSSPFSNVMKGVGVAASLL